MINLKGKHTKKSKYSIFTILLLIALVCICIASIFIFIYWIKSNLGLENIEEGLKNNYWLKTEDIDNDTELEQDNEKYSVSVDFNNLQQINSDIKAWIYIEKTNISYPILQSKDNEYYLKRDIYKKDSSCGSIFLDCNNNCEFIDDNTIIYGHNLKNQKMFADLNKIYNGELGNEFEIEIYTLNTVKKYNIITAYMEKPNLDIIQRNFNDNEKKDYISKNIDKSNVEFKYDLKENSNLITLVTCDITGKKRIVITACEI